MAVTMPVATGITIEEFLTGAWPQGAQLIDGEVVVNDPTFRHQRLAGRLFRKLAEWSETSSGSGTAGFGGNWTIGPGQTLKPDAWWTSDDNDPGDGIRSDRPPDLVVEVRSPGTWHLDTGRKRELYEQAGAAELWLVDINASSVLVYRRSQPDAAEFDVSMEVASGEILSTPLLPGLIVVIDELFAP